MRKVSVVAALLAVLMSGASSTIASAQSSGRQDPRLIQYDNAYRLGFDDGARDARRGRAFEYDHERRVRRGSPAFRRGYVEGYRAGFDSVRVDRGRPGRWQRYGDGGGFEDPAVARGRSEGYRRGFEDGRDRDRYDPVRHGDYRDGDQGYFRDYGSRDGYKISYRDGFRRGYDEGYREGSRASRR